MHAETRYQPGGCPPLILCGLSSITEGLTVSLTFSQRFRNLAEQYKAVLERWWVFWELVTLDSPDRYRKAIDAWEGVKQAFLTAANTLAELRRDVPPEVANLWIGPTERVFVGYGSLRVGAALDKQAKWFQKWMREVMGQRGVGWIWERGFYAELGRLEQAIEDLMTAGKVIQEWEGKRQAEAVTTRLENPSATREETAQTPVAGDVPNDKGDYVPVSTIYKARFPNYKQFRRWLDKMPESEIRRYKPRINRLCIHIGDWHNYWRTVDEEVWKRMDEVEARQKTPQLDRN